MSVTHSTAFLQAETQYRHTLDRPSPLARALGRSGRSSRWHRGAPTPGAPRALQPTVAGTSWTARSA